MRNVTMSYKLYGAFCIIAAVFAWFDIPFAKGFVVGTCIMLGATLLLARVIIIDPERRKE